MLSCEGLERKNLDPFPALRVRMNTATTICEHASRRQEEHSVPRPFKASTTEGPPGTIFLG